MLGLGLGLAPALRPLSCGLGLGLAPRGLGLGLVVLALKFFCKAKDILFRTQAKINSALFALISHSHSP